jgi:hypothetical protein
MDDLERVAGQSKPYRGLGPVVVACRSRRLNPALVLRRKVGSGECRA